MLPRLAGRPLQAPPPAEAAGGQIKDMEKTMILDTLARMDGSRKRTAEALGISERTLRYKLQRYREEGQLDGDFCL
jgi:two-component system response regulator FlrC